MNKSGNMEYVYSSCGSTWNESISEVLSSYISEQEDLDGEGSSTVILERGVMRQPSVSEFTKKPSKYLLEGIQEAASEVCWEWQDEPFKLTEGQSEELQGIVRKVVEDYYTDNKVVAGYFEVEEVVVITVTFTYNECGLIDFDELVGMYKHEED